MNTQTQQNQCVTNPNRTGEGEREKRHEAEAVHLQHLGNGVEMDCSPIPNSNGTVDKEK